LNGTELKSIFQQKGDQMSHLWLKASLVAACCIFSTDPTLAVDEQTIELKNIAIDASSRGKAREDIIAAIIRLILLEVFIQ
ncbi:hypothetical protein P6709_20020, partial [Jeotgalibacillus sp. ET6]|uniref:hypothetical protein n=1 Tax=Jeotgalibacillus sp. ET6 TaxID=3037260 RepID=UPI002418B2B7